MRLPLCPHIKTIIKCFWATRPADLGYVMLRKFSTSSEEINNIVKKKPSCII